MVTIEAAVRGAQPPFFTTLSSRNTCLANIVVLCLLIPDVVSGRSLRIGYHISTEIVRISLESRYSFSGHPIAFRFHSERGVWVPAFHGSSLSVEFQRPISPSSRSNRTLDTFPRTQATPSRPFHSERGVSPSGGQLRPSSVPMAAPKPTDAIPSRSFDGELERPSRTRPQSIGPVGCISSTLTTRSASNVFHSERGVAVDTRDASSHRGRLLRDSDQR